PPEFVNIDEQNGKLVVSMSARPYKDLSKAIQEQCTIRQSRQPVMQDIVREHIFNSLPVGYVPVDNDNFSRSPSFIADYTGRRLEDFPRSVLMHHAIFQALSTPRETCFLSGTNDALTIFRMYLLNWRSALQILGRITKHFLICRAVVKPVTFCVDYCNHIGCIFRDQFEEVSLFI